MGVEGLHAPPRRRDTEVWPEQVPRDAERGAEDRHTSRDAEGAEHGRCAPRLRGLEVVPERAQFVAQVRPELVPRDAECGAEHVPRAPPRRRDPEVDPERVPRDGGQGAEDNHTSRDTERDGEGLHSPRDAEW